MKLSVIYLYWPSHYWYPWINPNDASLNLTKVRSCKKDFVPFECSYYTPSFLRFVQSSGYPWHHLKTAGVVHSWSLLNTFNYIPACCSRVERSCRMPTTFSRRCQTSTHLRCCSWTGRQPVTWLRTSGRRPRECYRRHLTRLDDNGLYVALLFLLFIIRYLTHLTQFGVHMHGLFS